MSRIVLHTFGSLGDLHPYLAVGRVLRARGHAVLVATHADYRERIERAGLAFHPVPPELGQFADLDEVFRRAMDARTGSQYVLESMCLPFVRASTHAALAANAGADMVVVHALCFGATLAAEKLGIPRVYTVLQPSVMFSASDPPLLVGLPFARLLAGRGPRTWRLLYALMRHGSRRWFRIVDEVRAELGLPPDKRHPLFECASPHLNLALFSSVLMAPQPDWPPHTLVTGFPVFDRGEHGEGLPAELAEFLAAGPAPLVFTLGSSAVFTAGTFYSESLAAARALGLRAVLLCGPDGRNRPAGMSGADVLAVDYAPHSEVFPRAAAVVHQGGIGTTGQALRSGRPMLVMPVSHDQPDNAGRCVRIGVARALARRDYRAPRVAAELRALLADPAVAERARQVGARTRAEDGAGSAASAIEALLARR